MSLHSSIEWNDATWNSVRGRTTITLGFDDCYAESFAENIRETQAGTS
jgi:protein gp37